MEVREFQPRWLPWVAFGTNRLPFAIQFEKVLDTSLALILVSSMQETDATDTQSRRGVLLWSTLVFCELKK